MKQIEFIGYNSIINLKTILFEKRPKSIFLVTGKKSYESCGAKSIVESYLRGYDYLRFCDFEENPIIEDVEKGIKLFKENNCDFVIAVGGGSVIDMAKSINCFQANDNFFDIISNNLEIENNGKTYIAIPTTSGTGSEATHFAVLYVNGKKYSIADQTILPDFVIVDVQFTYNLPKYLTAVTGIDAFAQALESYWSVNSNIESLAYAKESIELLWEYLPKAVNEKNKIAREKVAIGSNLAGKAINITKTTIPHALSYYLTSKYNVSHGQAVAVFLADFLKFNYEVSEKDCNDKRGAEFVKEKIEEVFSLLSANNIQEAKQKIIDFIKSIGLASSIKDLNKNISIDEVYKNINMQRMVNNPRKFKIDG